MPGRFDEFEGSISFNEAAPELSSVQFTIQAASIDANERDRDTHLRSPDFFDVEPFPHITSAVAVSPEQAPPRST